jgi:Zn-dependent M32 family carboxypeptidase
MAARRKPNSVSAEEALQETYDLGDALDSNHARWCAMSAAERLGITIRVHNDFSEPPRNRNVEQIAALQDTLDRVRQYAQNNLDVWYESNEPVSTADHLARAYADIYQKILNVIDTGSPMGQHHD